MITETSKNQSLSQGKIFIQCVSFFLVKQSIFMQLMHLIWIRSSIFFAAKVIKRWLCILFDGILKFLNVFCYVTSLKTCIFKIKLVSPLLTFSFQKKNLPTIRLKIKVIN